MQMDSFTELKAISVANRDIRDKHIIDCRIHLCLYFIDGSSRLNVKDVLNMKKLKEYMNIIPVVVGDDPYVDEEEIEAIKDLISKDARDYGIDWLDIRSEVRNLEEIIQESKLAPIAPYPPFWFQKEVDEET